ncbi:hypothetical protein [Williamsia deligens]|uniref:Uncharacterized protein n=1 Tax=Williamsia deligens TaxID=321325 RepID=A0ABW3G736_9NOCA|nr:hypothetical protein [Williamsia deligens]MCP2194562.1 hypothetical protein [Williamsia deligens]
MSRLGVEYAKAGLLGVFAVIALIAIVVGGAPSPIYIALPVILGLVAIGIWWRAETVHKS